jgi:hypothetical protein
MKTRPGDGSQSIPPPPRRSTRICTHVRATPPAYAGIETAS